MAWTPFSSEAVELDTAIRKLHREGRISESLDLICKALEKAQCDGPSNETYEEFERRVSAS